MNKVQLIGRNVKDVDVRYTSGENAMAMAKFTLAVNRKFKKDEADFINCTAFGKTAELFGKYIFKGTKIAVCGHIQTGNYTNKDGQKVFTTEVIVDEIEFCESKSANNNQESNPANIADDFMRVDDTEDELPFA